MAGLVDALTTVQAFTAKAATLPPKRVVKEMLGEPSAVHDAEEAVLLMDNAMKGIIAVRRTLQAATGGSQTTSRIHATFERLLAIGDLIETADFLQRIGWTRQALSKAVLAKRLFFVEVAGTRAYPAFFLDPDYQRKDLEAVSKLLGDLPGGSKWLFFTNPKASLAKASPAKALPDATVKPSRSRGSLGEGSTGSVAGAIARTPLQALRAGDLEAVKRTALGFAER